MFFCQDKFKVEVFFVIVDQLSAELEKRAIACRDIDSKLGFLSRLTSLCNNEIHPAASLLVGKYSDFKDTFPHEIVDFAAAFF